MYYQQFFKYNHICNKEEHRQKIAKSRKMLRLCELILKDQLNRVPSPDAGSVKLTWYPGVVGWGRFFSTGTLFRGAKQRSGRSSKKDGIPKGEMSEIWFKHPFSISSLFCSPLSFCTFFVKNLRLQICGLNTSWIFQLTLHQCFCVILINILKSLVYHLSLLNECYPLV